MRAAWWDTYASEGVAIATSAPVAGWVASLRAAIARLVQEVASLNGVDADDDFAATYEALCAADRTLGAQVYDAVKELPEFARLCASDALLDLARTALGTPHIALVRNGNGIRIDRPNEDRFRAAWHQEFPTQGKSLNAAVLWLPLLEMTPELGPVEFCPQSHRDGIAPVHQHPDRPGAYGVRIRDEASRVARYRPVAPLTKPGDVVIIDGLTLHRSGENRGPHARWSAQIRVYDRHEPWGAAHGWPSDVRALCRFDARRSEAPVSASALPAAHAAARPDAEAAERSTEVAA